jgi:hypothetical protein
MLFSTLELEIMSAFGKSVATTNAVSSYVLHGMEGRMESRLTRLLL